MTLTSKEVILEFIYKAQIRRGNALKGLLQKYKYDRHLKKFLSYTYDINKRSYGVRAPELPEVTFIIKDLSEMYMGLNRLASREATGNEASRLADRLVEDFGIIAYSILHRKIPDSTVGPATINSVIPGLIYTFPVQKAREIDYKYVKYPTIVEHKYDGNFVQILGGKVYTRTGLPIVIPNLQLPNDVNLICEVIVNNGKLGDRRYVQGLITKGRKGTLSNYQAEDIKFVILDALTTEEAITHTCTRPYSERLLDMDTTVNKLNALYDYTFMLPEFTIANNKAEVQKAILEVTRDGYEGVVLKSPGYFYEFKRSRAWMRCKATNSVDLQCIGFNKATQGKNKGGLGSLICVGTVEGQRVEVNVGQGFSDRERQYPPEHWIGYTIEITYNEVSSENRLNIPLFISRREPWDKQGGYNA